MKQTKLSYLGFNLRSGAVEIRLDKIRTDDDTKEVESVEPHRFSVDRPHEDHVGEKVDWSPAARTRAHVESINAHMAKMRYPPISAEDSGAIVAFVETYQNAAWLQILKRKPEILAARALAEGKKTAGKK